MWRPLALRTRLSCVVLGLLLSCFLSAGARAQSEDVRERAKALFEKGLEASDSERWAEAADLFARSRSLLSRPSTVFNLVGALYRLGRYREGLAAARDYLAMSDPLVDAAKRNEVEGLRAVMQKAIGTARVEVVPADSTLDVDGERQVGEQGRYTLLLDPGLHALLARHAGHRDHRESFAIESGGSVNLRVELQPAERGPVADPIAANVSVSDPSPPAQPAPNDQEPKKRLRRALWITGAVVVVAAGAATALALTLGSGPEKTPCRTDTCVVID